VTPKYLRRTAGLTLIEIMVGVAIVSILAAIVVVRATKATPTARDAKRKMDLTMIKAALDAYYEVHGAVPMTGPGVYYSSEPGDNKDNGLNNDGQWIPGLAPDFIRKLPRDPSGGQSKNPACVPVYKNAYLYTSYDGKHYKLLAHCGPEGLMLPGVIFADDPFYDPVRWDWAWMVCNGEPACNSW
jgi:prepilin-type N-terminal cleavage/methylation domain-containing protein